MAAKYGDRFRNLPTTTSTHDVLDLGEVDQSEAVDGDHLIGPGPAWQRDPRWFDSGPARAVVVLALLAGALGGALGWNAWRQREADLVARQAVDLLSTMSEVGFPSNDQVALTLRYRNEGAYPLVLDQVTFDTDRLAVVDQPEPITVAPGATGQHDVTVRAVCPVDGGGTFGDAGTVAAPAMRVRATTVDGTSGDHALTGGFSEAGRQWMTYVCEMASTTPTFADAYGVIDAAVTADDGSVGVTIRVEFFDDVVDVEVGGVAIQGSAFAIQETGHHLEPTDADVVPQPSIAAIMSARLTVQSCDRALVAIEDDMAILVSGRVGRTDPGTVYVPPDATLALELVRLVARVCPAP